MALNRVELIARGLAAADKEHSGEIPLVTLIGNPHIKSLSPEEKVAVINRFTELTRGQDRPTPSLAKHLASGIGLGALTAIPAAMIAGSLTAPNLAEFVNLKNNEGLARASLLAAKKMAAPIAFAGMVGAAAGIATGAIRHAQDYSLNKYLQRSLENIDKAETQDEKDVHAMSLLAVSPHVESGYRTNAMNEAATRSKIIDVRVAPESVNKYMQVKAKFIPFEKVDVAGNKTYHQPDPTRADPNVYTYKNWSWVPGSSPDTEGLVDPRTQEKIRGQAKQHAAAAEELRKKMMGS